MMNMLMDLKAVRERASGWKNVPTQNRIGLIDFLSRRRSLLTRFSWNGPTTWNGPTISNFIQDPFLCFSLCIRKPRADERRRKLRKVKETKMSHLLLKIVAVERER